jgi:hypothetical protein
MEKMAVASIALFIFSTLTCKKIPGVCAAFAVAASSSLVAISIAEATAHICDKVKCLAPEIIEAQSEGKSNDFFFAPTNGKYGTEETVGDDVEKIDGRTIEVPLIRHETEERVEYGDLSSFVPLTYFL